MTTQHTAAIHTLATKLRMSDDARRDLMQALTAVPGGNGKPGQPGKRSCSDMSTAERALVREHLQRLVQRRGLGAPLPAGKMVRGQRMSPDEFAAAKKAASPRERKLWALWHALHRAGLVERTDRAALDAWVARQVQVSALRFCTVAQLDTCIEAAKAWLKRVPDAAAAPAAAQG